MGLPSGRRLDSSARDHCLYPVIPDPFAYPRITERPVPSDGVRPPPPLTTGASDLNQFHRRFKVLGLVVLTSGHFGHDRHTVPVRDQVKLRAKATTGPAQAVVSGFLRVNTFSEAPAAHRAARTCVPLMQNMDHSMPSSASSAA